MASQRSEDNDDNLVSTALANYPDYVKDEEIFSQFLQQHTALAIVPANPDDSDDDDDDIMMNRTRREPCYRQHLQRIKDRRYYENDNTTTALTPSAATNTFVVEIPLDELREFSAEAGDLAQRAANNTMRYQEIFCNVIDQALSGMEASRNQPNRQNQGGIFRDPIDILQEQRLQQDDLRRQQQQDADNVNNNNGGGGGINNIYAGNGNLQQDEQQRQRNNNTAGQRAQEMIPAVLLRRYELRILPFGRSGTMPPFDRHVKQQSTSEKNDNKNGGVGLTGLSLRNVRSKSMGHLVTITGMIVRSSEVKPALVVAAYACDACGVEVYQVIQNKREFMPQRSCPSPDCKQSDTLHLQTRASKFLKFQELKLQELPNQVPMGHIPRSLSVYCRGELTRIALPGDVVTIDGVFLPQRLAESGYRAMQAGLITTTYLEAQHIHVHKKSFDESLLDSNLSEEEGAALSESIMDIATSDDPIGRLAKSIAPEIFGHEDIKRALLLQLVGGCTRTLPDGMRIRGDINICLMGDPGVAKSQLLKQVTTIAPRGVYTTGKGSSGVGLTAAVTKDMATGEMALEGGAFVLGDRGLVSVDEFDKMDESDRTAIHEVMEQQTVSIAKAGIVATLNARTALLAAANPLYGRYNRSRSLTENINLPNSLLSRFDLMFLILDLADVDKDTALARHVTFVHQNEGLQRKRGDDSDSDTDDALHRSNAGETDKNVIPTTVLREYISRARRHQPVVSPEVSPYIVEAYVSLRMQDRPNGRVKKHGDQTCMTARQLLSILRLSQALARLRFSDFVAREDVDEAIRLTHMSKASLEDNDDDNRRRRGEDVMSRVFHIIRDYATVSGSNELEIRLCEAMALRKGFTTQQLQACLEEYEGLNVIRINSDRTRLIF